MSEGGMTEEERIDIMIGRIVQDRRRAGLDDPRILQESLDWFTKAMQEEREVDPWGQESCLAYFRLALEDALAETRLD